MRRQATYSQTSGASGSLVSGLASITLRGVKGGLGPGEETLTDDLQDFCTVWTYSRSLGSGEANVSGLASGSSWAGRSSATILSSRTLGEDNRKWARKSH